MSRYYYSKNDLYNLNNVLDGEITWAYHIYSAQRDIIEHQKKYQKLRSEIIEDFKKRYETIRTVYKADFYMSTTKSLGEIVKEDKDMQYIQKRFTRVKKEIVLTNKILRKLKSRIRDIQKPKFNIPI